MAVHEVLPHLHRTTARERSQEVLDNAANLATIKPKMVKNPPRLAEGFIRREAIARPVSDHGASKSAPGPVAPVVKRILAAGRKAR